MPIKIIWFSSVDLNNTNPKASGTWILSMYKNLCKRNDVQVLSNFYISYNREIQIIDNGNIIQYSSPASLYKNKQLTNKFIKDAIIKKILELNPDILHIWGTESYWGLLLMDPRLSHIKILLEIQGLKFLVGEKNNFYGSIPEIKINTMIGLKEIIYPSSSIVKVRKSFENWGKVEIQMLNYYKHINTQSEWIRNIIRLSAPCSNIYNTKIILRDSFIYSKEWFIKHINNSNPVIFSTSSPQPFKGIHICIKALKLVLIKYPNACLRIAGISINSSRIFNSAYINYLLDLIHNLDLTNHVKFLGNLDEAELLEEMYNADVFLNASFVESYCLALAEALSVGVPCIASYSSALPELINENNTGILFPVGDVYECASKIIDLLNNPEMKIKLSKCSSRKMRENIVPQDITDKQVSTYKNIILENNCI